MNIVCCRQTFTEQTDRQTNEHSHLLSSCRSQKVWNFPYFFWPPPGRVKYGMYLWFFSTCKGKICIVFWRDSQHFAPGENGYKGIQIEYFSKNFCVSKGLIWRKNSIKPPQIWLKIVTLVSEKKIKKVWNGVDPPRPVMENSILFIFIIFETFPNDKFYLLFIQKLLKVIIE